MQIDIEYMSKVFAVFLESDKASITIHDLHDKSIVNKRSVDEKFIFHMQLMLENKLISNMQMQSNSLKDIGITFGAKGHMIVIDPDIRLTQAGHDFANALNNNGVFNALKDKFKDAPFDTLVDVSKSLFKQIAEQKLKDIII